MALQNDWTDYVAVAGVVLILLPVLVGGGWIVAAFFVVVWLLLVKGVPFALEFAKERHSGAAAAKKKTAVLDERWDR